ncbi:Major facilitator superfamily multidrug transporter mfsB [Hyphodiscus hymeniophilus]|uniref:Major facilitator superfamily multidrug transporter mfsB n=1 Tax=Hyphodiscus hymeniophilus TaxID=353542 RepID=A0A9P6VMB6_9HELO|nr:Major facilitator superfamily multidrug transporter mfsB [Hyphodiscus hymeniophilus]
MPQVQTRDHSSGPSLSSHEPLPEPNSFSVLEDPVTDRIDEENTIVAHSFPTRKPLPVTWLSLPRKSQLFILFLCRLFDFLQVASLQAYLFYQLKSFDPELSDAAISSQAGILQGCFTGAQVATAMLWGKVADSSSGGRKLVLLVGLLGTGISCAGYGFATTFVQAALWRAFGGGINGIVGIIRTMIAEITKEKKYQSRAFLLLPMSFNVAGIIGPVMGGLLADPVKTLPGLFGPDAAFRMPWLEKYPYALPGVLNAIFLAITSLVVFFGIEETLKTRKDKFDLGIHLRSELFSLFSSSKPSTKYSMLSSEPTDAEGYPPPSPERKAMFKERVLPSHRLSFHRIFTRNVIFTLINIALFDFHLGSFTNLWSLFLSTPRDASFPSTAHLPFSFTGGLGMPASTVGVATSILGMLGMALQLFLYPAVHGRLGTLRSFRYSLILFPVAYAIAPYLVVLPSSSTAPSPAGGIFIWIGITLTLLLQVTARTFSLPATIILLNNCSPHPSVLGTVHGMGQSVSAAFRTIGPVVAGWWYGAGLEKNVVGAAWWATAGVAGAGCATAMLLYEGSGHEIFLPGEQDGEEETVEMEGLLSEGRQRT